MKWLKRHPFPVVASFDRVVALSFAFPENVLRPLVPPGLEIDTYKDFGFVTVALVWTKNLRPAGFPTILGRDFFLAGYRIFTLLNDGGRRLRGLKILRSETDKQTMVLLGNLMTGYLYHHVKTEISETGSAVAIKTSTADGKQLLDISFDTASENPGLPTGSPFPDWRTARRFAGPMPFTFSPENDGSFTVIEGSRESWSPRPVHVDRCFVSMFDDAPLNSITPILANAFVVENISYRWKKGRRVKPVR